ncbi:MAG: NUDIX domain-containing protein [Chloroflexi bacterium]|nr:NUDIX domain-containing protein [Chloroflexota bacterium]
MPRKSAGILLYRRIEGQLEVLLVHPGGPLWAHKDVGAWSIPKGEFEDDEEPLLAARREFAEETGFNVQGDAVPLAPQRQAGGKVVYAWVLEGNLDPAQVTSNTFSMEWPPKSGRQQEFPEIDRAAWFSLEDAKRVIISGQVGFLTQLEGTIG